MDKIHVLVSDVVLYHCMLRPVWSMGILGYLSTCRCLCQVATNPICF